MASALKVPSRPVKQEAAALILLIDPIRPRRIKVKLKGMAPLILDPMSTAVKESMRTGVKLSKAKDRTAKQVCEETLQIIRDSATHQITIPKDYLWGALLNGGEHVPYKGRMNISTAGSPGKSRKSRLPAFFRIENQGFVLIDSNGQEPAWTPKEDVGNGQTSKNETCRPVFENWGFEVVFQYDDGEVDEKTIRDLFSKAGKMSGLGCKRAGLGYDNGQFMVEAWEDITPASWPRSKKSPVVSDSAADDDGSEG